MASSVSTESQALCGWSLQVGLRELPHHWWVSEGFQREVAAKKQKPIALQGTGW